MASDEELYEVEILEGEIVPVATAALAPAGGERLPVWVTQPALQAAVVAATGFVAGAATMALLRRYGQARLERAGADAVLEPQRPGGRASTYVVSVRRLG